MQWIDEAPFAHRQKIIELARQYVAHRPGDAQGWFSLAEALRTTGLVDEALACLDDAVARFPDNARLRFCQALALQERGDFPRTLQALDATLSIAPDHRAARITRCQLLIKSRPKGGAMQVLDGVEAFVGRNLALARLQLTALFSDNALPELVAKSEHELAQYAGDTTITYLQAVALARLGRADEARSVITLDRFIDIAMLPVPAGFSSREAFCDQLAAEIARNPDFIPDPRGKATREGLLTWHVRNAESPAVEALLAQIKKQVDGYIARLGDSTHSFAKAKPDKAKLAAWGVLTEADGHQKSHLHPSGWLSGVFYVEAPRPPGESAFRGPLLLGALDEEEVDPPWGTLEVEPIPGRIVLFPSYLPHATMPPGITGRRIVVAFDVVPMQKAERVDIERVA